VVGWVGGWVGGWGWRVTLRVGLMHDMSLLSVDPAVLATAACPAFCAVLLSELEIVVDKASPLGRL
jgi:hypothetical protein